MCAQDAAEIEAGGEVTEGPDLCVDATTARRQALVLFRGPATASRHCHPSSENVTDRVNHIYHPLISCKRIT